MLAGRVAFITGASSGIGEATAQVLAGAGAKVAILARRKNLIAALAEKIEKSGGEALPLVADVSDQQEVQQAFQTVADRWGHLDVLVNNAGVMYLGPIDGANPSDWKRMLEINVLGLMYCTHAALPVMKKQNLGHIVNISSVSGKVVTARSAAYSATKFAVGAFSDGLRQEVSASGIRVTVVQPGVVATELADHIQDEATKTTVKSWVQSFTPLASQDIANAILFAVSQPPHVNVNELTIRPTEQSL